MAKRTKRSARVASAAILSTTVFANPAPPVLDRAPRDVIVNQQPVPMEPLDAGAPLRDDTVKPVIVNQVSRRPPAVLPDGGVRKPGK